MQHSQGICSLRSTPRCDPSTAQAWPTKTEMIQTRFFSGLESFLNLGALGNMFWNTFDTSFGHPYRHIIDSRIDSKLPSDAQEALTCLAPGAGRCPRGSGRPLLQTALRSSESLWNLQTKSAHGLPVSFMASTASRSFNALNGLSGRPKSFPQDTFRNGCNFCVEPSRCSMPSDQIRSTSNWT